MSDSDVFIVSAVQHKNLSKAIRQAMDVAGLDSSRVQDLILGLDAPRKISSKRILSASSLTCPTVTVSSSLRGVFFAAQSILSGDVDVAMVLGIETNVSIAFLLASPDAVGRWNLLPRARLAARSLNGIESAAKTAEVESKDVTIIKDGKNGARLINETMNELEKQSARWGMVTMDQLALLMERI